MLGGFFQRKAKDAEPKERALWGDLLSLGMVFPIAIFLGYLAGAWAGDRWGFPQTGRLVGLGLGIAAAFNELYKTAQRLNRADPPPPDPPDDSGA